MLLIEDLFFSYADHPIFQGVNLYVKADEIVALVGETGSGKTTLFQLITGLRQPHSGRISLDGPFSYMMQDDLLLPWRTILKNLELAGELTKNADPTLAKTLLEEVGLTQYAHLYPYQLSGGMRQKVSLARALMFQNSWLFLDEPFAKVDAIQKKALYAILKELKERYALSILFISHQEEDLEELADRVYDLDQGHVRERRLCSRK